MEKFKNYLILNGYKSLNYLQFISIFLKETNGEITQEAVNNFIVKNKDKYKNGTMNNFIKALKIYCKFKELDIKFPKLFKTTKKIPNYFKIRYLEETIIPAVSILFPDKKLKIETLLYFMFFTGLRKEEIMNVTRKDFNFTNRVVKITHKKSDKERYLPLTKKLIERLKKYFESEPEKQNAFNLGKGGITYIFNVLKGDKNNPNFTEVNLTPHSFRHSFATHLRLRRMDIQDIKDLLGHSDIKTTEIYSGVTIEDLQDKFDRRVK